MQAGGEEPHTMVGGKTSVISSVFALVIYIIIVYRYEAINKLVDLVCTGFSQPTIINNYILSPIANLK